MADHIFINRLHGNFKQSLAFSSSLQAGMSFSRRFSHCFYVKLGELSYVDPSDIEMPQ